MCNRRYSMISPISFKKYVVKQADDIILKVTEKQMSAYMHDDSICKCAFRCAERCFMCIILYNMRIYGFNIANIGL